MKRKEWISRTVSIAGSICNYDYDYGEITDGCITALADARQGQAISLRPIGKSSPYRHLFPGRVEDTRFDAFQVPSAPLSGRGRGIVQGDQSALSFRGIRK